MAMACLASTTLLSFTSSSFTSSSTFLPSETAPKGGTCAGRTTRPAIVVVGLDGGAGAESTRSPGQWRESSSIRGRRIARELRATGNNADQGSTSSGGITLVCQTCDGNGAVACSQCQGDGLNSVDHFNGRFKAGTICWLCRGKRQMLCGICNGAGFMGGFMNTQDE
jgi:DnaJ-class molecular chaperone